MTAARAPRVVTCAECGNDFEARSSRAKYCSPKCRKAASRRPSKRGKLEVIEGGKDAVIERPPAPTYDALAEQVTASLMAVNAYETIAGKAALRVAQQIDRGGDSGSAVATLSTQLMRLVEQAKTEAAPLNRDKVDDVIDAVNNKLLRLTS